MVEMKLNAKNLLVTKFACKGSDRPHLNRVLVEPDGTTVAVNGHAMAIVSPCCGVAVLEVGETKPAEAVHLPYKAAVAMAKELKAAERNEDVIEHNAYYVGTNDNGRHRFTRPDSEVGDRTITVPQCKADTKFPPWSEVTPNLSDDGVAEMYTRVSANAMYLIAAANALKEFTDHSANACTIHVSKDDAHAPIVLESKNSETGQTMTVVVMPLRS
jgi:hypothetical protein